MQIKLKVTNDELTNYYSQYKKSYDTDSGFDIVCPEDITIEPGSIETINFGIICNRTDSDEGYYLYPRSSLSKTSIRIIDNCVFKHSKFSGQLYTIVKNIKNKRFQINKGDRLFQICAPDLKPFDVELVDTLTTYMKLNLMITDDKSTEYYNESNNVGDKLYLPINEEVTIRSNDTVKINFGVAFERLDARCGYYLMIESDKRLRLANYCGIIDYTYRGSIMAVVDNITDKDVTLMPGTKMFYIASPDGNHIKYKLVDDLSETERGAGGFGSTNDKKQTQSPIALI
jgi:dUTP pyrophosphatase